MKSRCCHATKCGHLKKCCRIGLKVGIVAGAVVGVVVIINRLLAPPVEDPSSTDPWPALGEEYDPA